MPLHGDSLSSLVPDTDVVARAGRRIAAEARDELVAAAKRATPVAKPAPGVDAATFIAERGGRVPGTLKERWEGEGPDRSPAGWESAAVNHDPVAILVDEDTDPHVIAPHDPDGRLRFRDGDTGGVVLARVVQHPGTTGKDMTGKAAAHLETVVDRIAHRQLGRMADEIERG